MQAPLLGLGDAGGRQARERGAAARERCEHKVVRPEPVHELHHAAGGGGGALGWEGVVGDDDLDAIERDRVLAGADDDGPGVDAVGEGPLERGCDRERGLPRADHDHARARVQLILTAGDRDPRVRTRDGSLGRAADVACLEARPRHPQGQSTLLGHTGGGELHRVCDHAATAALNGSPG